MNDEIVKDGNDFYVKREKKIDHKKALNFVAEYINYDMQSKDRLGEIQWLLEQIYKGADIEHIVDDWDLDEDDFSRHYPFDVDNVKDFALFCLESGGFEIL